MERSGGLGERSTGRLLRTETPLIAIAPVTHDTSRTCTTAAPQRSSKTTRWARWFSPPPVTKRRSLYWPLSSKVAQPRDTSATNVGGAISTTPMERGSLMGSGSGSGSGSGCKWCGSANGLGRSGPWKGLAISDSTKVVATDASACSASSKATSNTGTSSPGGAFATAPSGAGTTSFTATALGSPGSTSGGNDSEAAADAAAGSLRTSSKGLLIAAIWAMMVASSSMSGWAITGEANGLSCGEPLSLVGDASKGLALGMTLTEFHDSLFRSPSW